MNYLFDVSKYAFNPVPKVESAVINMRRIEKLAYLKKEDCYAIYVQYNLYFLQGEAAKLFTKVLEGKSDVPQSYLSFLEEKQILQKAA